MKKNIITSLLIVLTNFAFGQYQQYEQYITPYLSDSIQSGYFYLNQPNNIQAGQLYQAYRQNAPDLNNNMVLIDTHVDSLAGLKHYKYEQTYMNIPIEGAGCIEHYNTDGSLLFLNGKFADSIKKSHEPKFGEEEAIKILLEKLKRDKRIKFAWEDENWEHQIQLDENDSTATWFPEAELIWAVDTMKNMQVVIPGSRYNLAYKISVTTISPDFETFIYYVNAYNGSILKFNSTHVDDGPASVYGYGSNIIDTQWKGGFTQKFILETNDATRVIHTKENPNGSTAWFLLDNTTDGDDIWGSTYLTETSTHFHVSKCWDYFRNYFGRTGQDNASKEVRVKTQWNAVNAQFIPGNNSHYLRFGKYNGWDFGMEPSVVAHEFTHGVTHHTSNLEYQYESGALNESFSDIFGVVIQAKMLDGGATDWVIGNFLPNSPIVRSLEEPLDHNQPNTYLGNMWYSGSNDNGGVHINSGVQNKWFYILANGDSGQNDQSEFYNITGIGINKASKIAYLALTSLLQNSSQYSDSRQATITASKILFGECSVEHQATIDAWYAVGIGDLNDCDYTLSTDDVAELNNEVLIYPNPAGNKLNIELPNKVDDDIQIFDATGKKVANFSNQNLVFSMDVSHLMSGVYFLNFSINENPIQKRFIIQK